MADTVVDSLYIELRAKTTALEQGLVAAVSAIQNFASRSKAITEEEARVMEAAARSALESAKKAAEEAAQAKIAAAQRASQAAREAESANSEAAASAAKKAEQEAQKAADAHKRAMDEVAKATNQLKQAHREAEEARTRKTEEEARKRADAEKKAAGEIEAANTAMAAAATAALAAVVSALKSAIAESNRYVSAMQGLQSLAEGTGQSFGALESAVASLTADGLMPASDAATALKNLLARGFSTEEAVDMVERLKDAAAYGRQASLSLGEAVRSASEGIKNENSVLVDNAGVTKNVSVMWKEYAAQIGKGVDSLTAAEKRQAEYNGIMAETRYQVGDAAKYAQTFAGTQAALEASTTRLQQALGSAVSDGLTPFYEGLTVITDGVAELASASPTLTAGVTGAAAAMLAAAAAAGVWAAWNEKLKATLLAVSAASKTLLIIGAVVGGIAALAAAISNYKTEAEKAAEKSKKLRDEVQGLASESANAEKAFAVLQDGTSATEELADARNGLAEQFPELVRGYDNEGNAILASNSAIREYLDLKRQELELKQKEAREATIAAGRAAEAELEQIKSEVDSLQRRKEELEGKLAAGQTFEYVGGSMGAGVNIVTELARVTDELAEKNAAWRESIISVNGMYMTLYEGVNEGLGELSEAEQYLVDKTMEHSAALGLSAKEYTGYVKAMLADTGEVAKAEAELAAQRGATESNVETYKDMEEALAAAREAASGKRRTQELINYVNAVKTGTKGTKEYEAAVEALSKEYGDFYPNVEDSIDAISAIVDAEDAASNAAVEAARIAISKMYDATTALWKVAEAGSAARRELTQTLSVLAALDSGLTSGSFADITLPTVSGGGGGGGGSRKKEWEKELELLEHQAALGEDVAERQIAAMQRILNTARLSQEEKWELEEDLYAKQQELIQKQLDDKLSLYQSIAEMDKEELENHILILEEMLAREDITDDEQKALTTKLNEYRLASDGEYFSDYLAHLEKLVKSDQFNAEQRLQIWQSYTDARLAQEEAIKQAQADAQAAATGVVEDLMGALKNKYTEEKSAAVDALNAAKAAATSAMQAQIQAINKARDAQLSAIDDEIAALDALLAAKKRQTEDENDEDQLARLKAALEYEKDEYNRTQLSKQIADKEAEIAQKKWEREISDQKAALKEKQEAIREEAALQVEALQAQLTALQASYSAQLASVQAFYDEKLSKENLMQEAINLMTEQHEKERKELLEKYYKENIEVADVMGDLLKTKFAEKFAAITEEARKMAQNVKAEVAAALAAQATLAKAQQNASSAGGQNSGAPGQSKVEITIKNDPAVVSEATQKQVWHRNADGLVQFILR